MSNITCAICDEKIDINQIGDHTNRDRLILIRIWKDHRDWSELECIRYYRVHKDQLLSAFKEQKTDA
jgi:hypothetical protein